MNLIFTDVMFIFPTVLKKFDSFSWQEKRTVTSFSVIISINSVYNEKEVAKISVWINKDKFFI